MSKLWGSLIFSILIYSSLSAQKSWNVRFVGYLRGELNNLWGYAQDEREYALLVRNEDGPSFNGIVFKVVDITNPSAPKAIVSFPAVTAFMQEVETYQHYAYVCENFRDAPIQIFDLSFLPDSVKKVADYYPSSGGGCHTILIKDGYCYCNEGNVMILDLKNPVAPQEIAIVPANYAHDCFVYKDTLYIADIVGDTFGGIIIYDVQDKTNPVFLKKITYSNSATHTVETTEDGKYILTCDENIGGHLKIWDKQDFNNIHLVSEFETDSEAIIHISYVKGNLVYLAYYTDGLRVLKLKDPTLPEEVGYYDTSPYNIADYEGAWGAYPYLPSGNVLVSDLQSGLWILRFEVIGGDYDADSSITFLDIVFLVNYIFKNGTAPKPVEAGDVNSDCKVNIGDVIYLVNYLFKDGPTPTPACF